MLIASEMRSVSFGSATSTTKLVFRAENIVQACFDAVLKLSQPQAPTGFAALYGQLRALLDQLLQQPASCALGASEARDIAYAIVALADEKALQASPELAEFWLPRRLQLHYFDDNMAGEGFFARLDAMRQRPGNHVTLQAYYLALALGFEGRYGHTGGGAEIVALMASLRQTLVAQATFRPEALSAHGVPQTATAKRKRWHRTPAAGVAALVAGAAVLCGVMYVDLRRASAQVVALAEAVAPRVEG